MKEGSEPKPDTFRYVSQEIAESALSHRERIVESARAQVEQNLSILKSLDRPKAMAYFDGLADYFGRRASELQSFKEKGGKVIGTLCYFAPAEVISAFGAVPIRMCSGFYESVHPANDLLGDAGLCPLVKSTLGLKMSKASPLFEACDMLIVPTPCDAKLKIGEILQDEMEVHMMNTPAIKRGEAARKAWVEEVRNLVRVLERKFGRKMKSEDLKRSIMRYQKAQEAWRRFTKLRMGGGIWGRDALLVAQISFFDDIGRWTKNVNALSTEIESRKPIAPEAARILLAGSPIIWPNWKVPNLVEESKGLIISDDLCSSTRTLYDPVVVEEWTLNGMLTALAERYMMPCTCPCFSPNQEREEVMLNRIKESKAEGVIYHVLRGCHLNSLDATKAEMVLRKNSIPMIKVESEYDEGDVEQLRTRIEAFIEMIHARREFGG
jgi:benzoyl-CoA reductase/2-hydroxyglutaryl-CoA dehydratase subunit BcrC/BadD/HgdB